jgi:hypothetical protein
LVWRSTRFVGSRIDKIADPALRKQVARNALHVIVKMVFEDGLFHADPHLGNIIFWQPRLLRCMRLQAILAPPPNNSFKPTPLCGAA